MVFVLSDFQSTGNLNAAMATLRRSLALLRRKHDVVALHIDDPRERRLPNIGLITLEDAENDDVVEVDTGSARVREAFAKRATERRAAVNRAFRAESIDSVAIETGKPYLPALVALFESRHRARRGALR